MEKNNHRSPWPLIIVGTLLWSLTMVKSGWVYSYGMGFWGANGHDGIWHIALIEGLSKGSLGIPVFSGAPLQNYHIGFDLLLALIHKITSIPVVNLYFQVIPGVLAFLVGILTYNFVLNWTKSVGASVWSTLFVYFGGSFGWMIGKGESAFWSQQAVSSLINPPFAFSLVILLLGLICLQKSKYIFAAVLFGLLIEIKVYIGIRALGSLLMISVWRIIKARKYEFFWVFAGALILSLIVYLPLNRNSQGLMVWQPFWFLETMMSYSDRLNWQRFYSAMTTYKSGHIWYKLIPSYLVALTIFYVGNLGTRIFHGYLVLKRAKNLKLIDWEGLFIILVSVAGMMVPTFFLQKGTPWNTIQFFYYSIFFSSLLAGAATAQFFENSKLSVPMIRIIGTGIVLLTIPTTIITLKDVYIPGRPPAMLSNEELSALKFLSKREDGAVLTYPFDPIAAKAAEASPPRPLYLYVSNAYVSAFSKHETFLEDEVNLDITGYDWRGRRVEVTSWYKESSQVKAREFLKKNNIKYIYWLKGQRAMLGEGQLGLRNIYENSAVTIYQVEPEGK